MEESRCWDVLICGPALGCRATGERGPGVCGVQGFFRVQSRALAVVAVRAKWERYMGASFGCRISGLRFSNLVSTA